MKVEIFADRIKRFGNQIRSRDCQGVVGRFGAPRPAAAKLPSWLWPVRFRFAKVFRRVFHLGAADKHSPNDLSCSLELLRKPER